MLRVEDIKAMSKNEYAMNSINAVLQLLMLTVYADRVRHPDESKEICRQISKLQIFTDVGLFPDVTGINNLIEKHDAEARNLMDSSSLDEAIEASINRIDSPILIPMVISALHIVANADSEFHEAEERIISRAAEVWGVVS
jgi:uncharacterized tellurite resistance protein B-like protein